MHDARIEYSVYLVSQLINMAMDKLGRETDIVTHNRVHTLLIISICGSGAQHNLESKVCEH